MTTAKLLWKREYSDARCQAFPAKVDPVQLAAFRVREKLRTIQLGIGARGAVGLGLARQRGGAAVSPWWLAGGAPTPVAVYQPKGAASLAASYSNLVNPGTYDAAPGVAPTLDTVRGWITNGTNRLTTGLIPTVAWSALVRFSNVPTGNLGYFFGETNQRFGIRPARFNTTIWANAGMLTVAGETLSGVLALAGNSAYKNGLFVDVIPGSTELYTALWLFDYAAGARPLTGDVQAVAFWNTSTDHAIWMPAVSAAIAAL